MSLKQLASWTQNKALSISSIPCGGSEELVEDPVIEEASSCGSACGSGGPAEETSSCGANAQVEEVPTGCGSACGA